MEACPKCGFVHPPGITICEAAQIAARPDPLLGSLLVDKYEIQRLIGIGGMGRVYAALDTDLNRRVAIKVLAQHLANDSVFVSRFKREARASAATGHPNIVQVLDFGRTADGRPFMAMELLEGRDLSQELKALGVLPLERAVDICGQTLFALSAAHAAGIVHRDLKPGNIFLLERRASTWNEVRHPSGKPRDAVKILDFGLSRYTSGDEFTTELTKTGVTMGTAAYMAPEQIREHGRVDHRADLYSVAVILFYCVTGQKPFSGGALFSLLQRVLEEAPPAPTSLRPDLPKALDVVLRRGMAKLPDERFATAEEFMSALLPFQATGSSPRYDDQPTRQLMTPESRRIRVMTPLPEQVQEAGALGAAIPDLDVDSLPPVYGSDADALPTVVDRRNPLLDERDILAAEADTTNPHSVHRLDDESFSNKITLDYEVETSVPLSAEPASDEPPALLGGETDELEVPPVRRFPRWLGLVTLFGGALGLGLSLAYLLWALGVLS